MNGNQGALSDQEVRALLGVAWRARDAALNEAMDFALQVVRLSARIAELEAELAKCRATTTDEATDA